MKRAFILIFAAIMILSFCSCVQGGAQEDSSFESGEEFVANKTIVARNGYLGVQFSVPSGWYVHRIDYTNLSEKYETTAKIENLDVFEDEGYFAIQLLDIANLANETDERHVRLIMFAEKYETEVTIEEYMDAFQAWFVEGKDESAKVVEYSLIARDKVTMGGIAYEHVMLNVDGVYENDELIEEFFAIKRKDYYLMVAMQYWPDGKKSRDDVVEKIKESLVYAENINA